MSGELRVEYDVLSRGASDHHGLAAQFAKLDARRADADLPPGSLGRLPASDEIQAAFDARYQGLGEALAALEEIYGNIGDALGLTLDAYRGSDEAVRDMFTKLLSGGR